MADKYKVTKLFRRYRAVFNKIGEFLNISYGPGVCTVLGEPVDGPLMYTNASILTSSNLTVLRINPWRYNSSNPTNNVNSYDLWVDIIMKGKTNRYSNWSTKPQIVGAPHPPDEPSAVPPELATEFAAHALIAGAVFWLSMGPLLGYLTERFARAMPFARRAAA